MKKQNENGFAHLQMVFGLVLLVGLVSFAGYRVSQNHTNNQKSAETGESEITQNIKAVELDEKQQEEVIPVKEEIAPVVVEEKKANTEASTEKKKTEKTWLKMTKVSAVQTGSIIDVVSKLPQALTGTCNFKLWQDGFEKVYSSANISNSTDCVGQLSVAELPTYTGWSLHVWFDSSDGKTSASQPEEAITIQVP